MSSRSTHALVARQRLVDTVNRRRRRSLPRAQYRRYRQLVCATDLWSPELVADDDLLVALSARPWVRPWWTWVPQGDARRSLIRHLLVPLPHPLPDFLFVGTEGLSLLCHLGAGGSLRAATRVGLLPADMTRRMCHQLMQLEAPWPLSQAICVTQVAGLGGPPWLAHQFAAAYARLRHRDPAWWDAVIRWACRHHEQLPEEHLPAVLDWWLGHDQCGHVGLLKRSAARVLAYSEAWHVRFRRYQVPLPLRLPTCGVEGFDDGEWRIREILRGDELLAEGRALRHCVATYAHRVQKQQSAIFSLRHCGVRRVTIEVAPGSRRVVQVRGLQNRRPDEVERGVVEAWARQRGLEVFAV
jgi:hypothetical protein